MTDVQNVENAVSKNQLQADGPQTREFNSELIERNNLLRHYYLVRTPLACWQAGGLRTD
jgi:hypothetical protein